MASNATAIADVEASALLEELRILLWGSDIKHDVFSRWTQGIKFSDDEPTALLQEEGGPCAIIAPTQAYLLKNLLFSDSPRADWRNITEEQRDELLVAAIEEMVTLASTSDVYTLVYFQPDAANNTQGSQAIDGDEGMSNRNEDESTSSPNKKQCFSHDNFHLGLRCKRCFTAAELHNHLQSMLPLLCDTYGVLSLLYSIALTRGIEQIKNEVEDPLTTLIDGTYGHGSQSLINLLLTGRAVSNVWDNDKDVSGLKLKGISSQSQIGFLTQLEHLRYCEVGWYLKNPVFPLWLLGSETHLTLLFSRDRSLSTLEPADGAARRAFSSLDTDGSGFIVTERLAELMEKLDLVSDPEYVKIMAEKLDPESLGIVTLSAFLDEFFPPDPALSNVLSRFTLYHYNGLKRSNANAKVQYIEGVASIMESPEVQIITDTSDIKTCLMTKWPTIELKWSNDVNPPSLN